MSENFITSYTNQYTVSLYTTNYGVSTDSINNLFTSTYARTQDRLDALSGTILVQGIDYFQDANYDQAIKSFKQAAALSPSSDNAAKAYGYIGQAYARLEETDKAINTYKEAIRLYPADDTFYIALGDIYLEEDMLEEATTAYRQAVNINSNNAESQYSLGQAYLNAGELDKANDRFSEIVRISPNSATGYYGLGQSARQDGDLENAVSQLTKAISVNKDFELAHLELGYAYADMGEFQKAQDVLATLEVKESTKTTDLENYITRVTQPRINMVLSLNGFNTRLPAHTEIAKLSSTLQDANKSKLFSLSFTFSKEMDQASIINPYNWKISRATIQENGGVYNGGLIPPSTEATILPKPTYVTYDADSDKAIVYFRLYQNETADATIDPNHIVFKFSGIDAYSKSMDTSADEYSGFSKIA